MKTSIPSRRNFMRRSMIGAASVAAGVMVPNTLRGRSSRNEEVSYGYPSINDEVIQEVVGASHGRFDRVKELVTARPELALATWDWGFGDFETALGAASHMARTDIADFLMRHGARPDIFTFAMMGSYEVVKAMIEQSPGIQRIPGPHGITLLQHARNKLRRDLTAQERRQSEQLIQYLESLGDADLKRPNLPLSNEEKEMYKGEYRFGKTDEDVFEISLNMRQMLQVGRKGEFGRPLNKIGKHQFSPSAAPSVELVFRVENTKAVSFMIKEPGLVLEATRI